MEAIGPDRAAALDDSGDRISAAGRRGRRTRLLDRALTVAAVAYAAGVVVGLVLIRTLGDDWWLATILLFGPRWLFVVPAPLLAAAALARRRWRALGLVAATALLALGPLMGLCLSRRALLGTAGQARDLRVMTFNVAREWPTSPHIRTLLLDLQPDVAVLQECMGTIDGAPIDRDLPGWHVHIDDQLCLLSRFPIRAVDSRDRRDVWEKGGSGAMVRYELEAPFGTFHVVNVHLETVREGLIAIRHRDLEDFRGNIAQREWESELARGWADRATGPVLVAGDFNLPVESAIYRRHWADLEDAFSAAGAGWGATKHTRLFGSRIDHVLAGPGWECVRAFVGPEAQSDHRPLVADYRLRGDRRP